MTGMCQWVCPDPTPQEQNVGEVIGELTPISVAAERPEPNEGP